MMRGRKITVFASAPCAGWLDLLAFALALIGLAIMIGGAGSQYAGAPFVGLSVVLSGLFLIAVNRTWLTFGENAPATRRQKTIWRALALTAGACLAAALGAGLSLLGLEPSARWAPQIALNIAALAGVMAVQTYGNWIAIEQRMPKPRPGGLGGK